MNERLKLMLWVELFDSTLEHNALNGMGDSANSEATLNGQQVESGEKISNKLDQRAPTEGESSNTNVLQDSSKINRQSSVVTGQESSLKKPSKPVTPYLIFLGENRERIKQELGAKYPEPSAKQIIQEATKRWNDMPDKAKSVWRKVFEESCEKYEQDVAAWKASGGEDASGQTQPGSGQEGEDWRGEGVTEEEFNARLAKELEISTSNRGNVQHGKPALLTSRETYPSRFDDLSPPPPPPDSNFRIIESAGDGIKKLEEGKVQLLKRLDSHDYNCSPAKYDLTSPKSPVASPNSPVHDEALEFTAGEEVDYGNEDDDDDEDYLDSEEEDESSDDDDEYAIPGEDGRGLLTDVPLILGPNEIEVLPMIIMSGIVADWKGGEAPNDTLMNMYTIRCHLLLAQENGRNLLRELLIFVAAWDLREEELYFKFMVKIIEAILLNGLMPFAYGAFKESKDIISPAQAVIMKLLTKIFHSRQAYVPTSPKENPIALLSKKKNSPSTSAPDAPKNQVANRPPRPDIQTVHFLFTEFRTTIIPQICALIFLQGQIRVGHAQLDDFPLNLWDMERMYEGVYQYLEFFAILTDHEAWKERMAEWEVVSELVTLLRELEAAIPKKSLVAGGGLTTGQPKPGKTSYESLADPSRGAPSSTSPAPVAVERPYDVTILPSRAPSSEKKLKQRLEVGTMEFASQLQALSDMTTAANDNDGTMPPPPTPPAPPPAPLAPRHTLDEPADFEWRNLKKLCVLVLSSLVWKNKTLQDQVRNFGGINVLLSCCSAAGGVDEYNPYIREHAIMCLRFLIEGNEECAKVVRGLSEKNRAHDKAAKRKKHGAQSSETMQSSWTTALDRDQERYEASGDDQQDPEVPAKRAENREPRDSASPDQSDEGGEGDEFPEDFISVPDEVLDHHGYETFMDSKGQVGLRRKELSSASFHPRNNPEHYSGYFGVGNAREGQQQGGENQHQSQTHQIPPPKHPAQLPEWMQMVMKSLPKADGIGSGTGASANTSRS